MYTRYCLLIAVVPIINNVPFHSETKSGLDDKLYGHPTSNLFLINDSVWDKFCVSLSSSLLSCENFPKVAVIFNIH